jgi:hypothetical protein
MAINEVTIPALFVGVTQSFLRLCLVIRKSTSECSFLAALARQRGYESFAVKIDKVTAEFERTADVVEAILAADDDAKVNADG